MRPDARLLACFAVCAALLLMRLPARADSNPILPNGGTATFAPTGYNDNAGGLRICAITNSAGTGVASTGSPGAWTLSYDTTKSLFKVTAPAGTTPDRYTITYGQSGTGDTFSGPYATFTIAPVRPLSHPGAPFAWEGGSGGVNLGNGNMLTSVPLVGWTARGGLPVSFALTHNSQSSCSGEIAPKWIGSYDVTLNAPATQTTTSYNKATVTWGDEQSYDFTPYVDTSTSPATLKFVAASGLNDTLTFTSGSSPYYDITTTDQVKYHFLRVGTTTTWRLVSITDQHNNSAAISYNTSNQVSQVADQQGRALTLGYVGNQLKTVADPLARQWTLNYTGALLTSITYPTVYEYASVGASGKSYLSATIAFGYDSGQNITSIKDKNGNTVRSAYSGNSLASLSDALLTPNTTTFTYNATATVVTDANNHPTVYAYADSRVQSVTDATNKTAYTLYDAYNNVSSVKDKNGNTTSYGHTSNGETNSVIQPLTPDGLHHTTSTTYTTTNKPFYTLDPLAYVSGATTSQHQVKYTYSTDGKDDLLYVTDQLGRSTYYGFDPSGLPIAVADGAQQAASTGTTMAYDTFGDLIKTTDADGIVGTATYNTLGWKMTGTSGLDGDYSAVQTSAMRYDEWGRVKAVSGPPAVGLALYRCVDTTGTLPLLTSSLAEYGADIAGSTWKPVGPVGGVYDPAQSAPASTVPLYRFVNNTTNDRIYSRSSTAPGGYTSEGSIGFVYATTGVSGGLAVKPLYGAVNGGRHLYTDDPDEYNRLFGAWILQGIVCYLVSNTATTQYDLNGNVVAATDANGHGVTNIYDADDRLTQSTNARGDSTTFTYGDSIANDPRKGLLAYKTNGNGKQTHYAYTARNEVAQVRYPLQQGQGQNYLSEYFTYDGNGNVQTRTKRDGHTIEYTYDAANRLTDIKYYVNYFNANGTVNANRSLTSTHTVQFGYDAADRRTSMIDGTGTTNWAYENNNLLSQIASPQGTVNYQHSDAANRLTKKYLGSGGTGPQWTYGYDLANRPQSLAGPNGTTSYNYDAAGRVGYYVGGNGVHTNFAYNAAGLVSAMSHVAGNGAGTVLGYYGYQYDAGGRTVERDDNDGSATKYQYDAASQLTQETRTGPSAYSIGFDYDGNHNRAHTYKPSATETYNYDGSDELVSRATPSTFRGYTYDANGNQVQQTQGADAAHVSVQNREAWDDEDRLTGWVGGSKSDTFLYNGLGLRMDKEDSTGSHVYITDGSSAGSSILYDLSGSVFFTPGLSENDNGVSKFYHADALGSTRGLTDAGQNPTDGLVFNAFGESVSRTGTTATEAQFGGTSGYRTDADTKLQIIREPCSPTHILAPQNYT